MTLEQESPFKLNDKVRVLWGVYFGSIGTVVGIRKVTSSIEQIGKGPQPYHYIGIQVAVRIEDGPSN